MKDKVSQITSIITIPVLLALGTLGVYLYAKGYRLDIPNGSLEKTGVISVKTIPRRADVSLDGKSEGKSPRALSGVQTGEHTIAISKDGYFSWETKILLEAEQLIPFKISLFLKEPTTEDLFPEQPPADTSYSRTLLGFHTDTANVLTIFSSLYEDETESLLELWSYPTKRRFWELNVSPIKIAEFQTSTLPANITENNPVTSVSIAPNGQKVLLELQLETGTTYYILETASLNSAPLELAELTEFSSVPPTWSKNSSHIIYSKNGELRSISTETGTNSIITEHDDGTPFIWNTNESGQVFFLAQDEKQNTAIMRTEANGSGNTTLLTFPAEFPQEEKENSDDETADGTVTAIGASEVYGFSLTPDEEHILLLHPKAIILYTLEGESYEVFAADSPQFLSFSPDEEKFLYLDGETILKSFRFVIEEGDPVHCTGPKTLLEITDENYPTGVHHITWHPESTNIFFTTLVEQADAEVPLPKEYALSIIDTESLQVNTPDITLESSAFSIDISGKYFIGRCANDTICSVTISE